MKEKDIFIHTHTRYFVVRIYVRVCHRSECVKKRSDSHHREREQFYQHCQEGDEDRMQIYVHTGVAPGSIKLSYHPPRTPPTDGLFIFQGAKKIKTCI